VHWTEIACRQSGDAAILEVRGQLTLSDEEASLFRQVSALAAGGVRRLIVNLRHVSYIDSVGVGEIVRSYMLMTRGGGTLVLCDVAPRVREILEATNLDTVLRMFDSEADALART
jgi:anti-sigma B factor antagonist